MLRKFSNPAKLLKLNIIYEDNHIISVEKKAGILTQGDITGKVSLLDITRNYIKQKYNKPGNVFLGLVHRLDKPVSGIIIFAKTSKAARRIHKEFLSNRINKYYIAVVENNREMSSIDKAHWNELKQYIFSENGISVVNDEASIRSKSAELKYRLISKNKKYSFLLINLISGRKHQIRAQLSSIGMPIVGDKKYGSTEYSKNKIICLHSYFMKFAHTTKNEDIKLWSKIPERFMQRVHIDEVLIEALNSIIESDFS